MLFLSIDTSSQQGSVALLDDDGCRDEFVLERGLTHGREAAAAVATLLERCGCSVGELDGVAVGVGPGTYTGIRVGVTLGKTLAFARRLPIVGVSSTVALAVRAAACSSSPAEDGYLVAPVLDGRQDFLYVSLLRCRLGPPPTTESVLPQWVDRAGEVAKVVLAKLQGVAGGRKIIVAGDGAAAFLEACTADPGVHNAFECTREDVFPTARVVGELARSELREARTKPWNAETVHRLVPVYLRATEAERKQMDRDRPQEPREGA